MASRSADVTGTGRRVRARGEQGRVLRELLVRFEAQLLGELLAEALVRLSELENF